MFELNDITYSTDAETLKLLRQYIKEYQAGNKEVKTCISVIMELGLLTGYIKKVA